MGIEAKRHGSVFGLVEVEFCSDGPARIKQLLPMCSKGQVPKIGEVGGYSGTEHQTCGPLHILDLVQT